METSRLLYRSILLPMISTFEPVWQFSENKAIHFSRFSKLFRPECYQSVTCYIVDDYGQLRVSDVRGHDTPELLLARRVP